jgi:hypothetical protein
MTKTYLILDESYVREPWVTHDLSLHDLVRYCDDDELKTFDITNVATKGIDYLVGYSISDAQITIKWEPVEHRFKTPRVRYLVDRCGDVFTLFHWPSLDDSALAESVLFNVQDLSRLTYSEDCGETWVPLKESGPVKANWKDIA